MKFPSKVTPYRDSTLAKFPIILKCLQNKDHTVLSLFNEIRNKMTLKEYIDALDCLYALKKIILKEGIIHYVDRNLL